MPERKGDDLEERLLDLAVRIIRVCATLPRKPAARHISNQLLRSGTAPAPNYAEARSAESQRDFVHKLKIALKELNESRIWLKMIIRAKLASEERMCTVLDECEQLCRVMGKCIQTSQANARNRSETDL